MGCWISVRNELLILHVEDPALSHIHGYDVDRFGARFPKPQMEDQHNYNLIVVDEAADKRIELPATNITCPMVDIFSDQSVALLGSRCEHRGENDYDLNGLIFDPSTGDVSRFLAGDGISHLGVDGQDRLWVGYFDEGVYGSFGWGSEGQPEPIGSSGLNCFNRSGKIIWRHDGQNDGMIDDCYALNVGEASTHYYFYSDFHLGTVKGDWRTNYRATDVSGSQYFAITDGLAVFTQQYDDAPDVISVAKISDQECRTLEKRHLVLPDGGNLENGQLFARNDALHYIDEENWYAWKISNDFI